MSIYYAQGCSAARLAAFVQRQKKLVEVIVDGQEGTITAFSRVIMQGCCRQIEEVRLWGEASMTQEGFRSPGSGTRNGTGTARAENFGGRLRRDK